MAKAASFSEPAIAPIRREKPVLGFALSLFFHAGVVGAFFMSLPYMQKQQFETPPLIVDLVDIADITAAPPKPTPKVEEEPPKPEPEPPKPTEEAAPKVEEPPPPEPPKPEPPPPPPPQPDPAPPPPKVTPPPPKPQPPKKKDDMAQLQELLKDMQKKQPPKPQEQNPTVPNAQTNNQVAAVSDRATMTELDAIRSHIEGCWRIDPGKEGIENLSAEIRVFITPDGSVQRADIVDMTRYFVDTQFRTFANSARIAVLACKGIPITTAHYNELKDMVLNFSPQGRLN